MQQVWPFAVVLSVGLHGATLTGVALYWGVQDMAPQSRPETRLNIASQPVAASTAAAAKPHSDNARAAPSTGQMLGSAAIPRTTAAPNALPIVKAPAVAALPADPLASLASLGAVLPHVMPTAAKALPAAVQTSAVTAAAAPTLPAQSVAAPTATLPAPMPAVAAAIVASETSPLPDTRPDAAPAPAIAPPSQRGTALLAWSSHDEALDPVSLAAIQAFMQPGDLATSATSAGRLRDGIAETLGAVPCARLQTSFNPETGSLELRGHLPEEGLRAPVLAAVQAQVGNGIPVTDRLRLLPRPQCGALTAIAGVGLAQSTEQGTNPHIIGPDTFVRDYNLTEGQRLVFSMTAPDYPSIVYVDYFDAAGMVLHMQPNDQVPAIVSPAKSTLAVGQDAPGVPALQLRVGPPFGQEIAVAFAASIPLYDGVRPTIEPAGPYLTFLKQAVAQARAKTPNFKGEWVYFFVTTAP